MKIILIEIYNNVRFYNDYVNNWILTFMELSDNYKINQHLDVVNTIQY